MCAENAGRHLRIHQLNLTTGTKDRFSGLVVCWPVAVNPLGVKRREKCVARQELRFPPHLFSAPSCRHQPRASITASPTASPMIGGRFTTRRSPMPIPAAVRRPVARPAAMPAPLHQTAGNGLIQISTRKPVCVSRPSPRGATTFSIPFRPVYSSRLPLFVAVAQNSIGEWPGRACSNHLP
jgi:hypothetical protein